MEITEPVSRLTEREKEVLRLWLHHKTAKEIALDIGISHHAVEKRLKMARTKLDVASSLDAARVLAQVEGYDQAVPYSPGIVDAAKNAEKSWVATLTIGFATMTILATTAVLLFAQSGSAELSLKPGDLLLVAPTTFEQLDEDGSGYLEGDEAPPLIRASGDPTYMANGDGTAELSGDEFQFNASMLRNTFYEQADTDADGKVSVSEYREWVRPQERQAKGVRSTE